MTIDMKRLLLSVFLTASLLMANNTFAANTAPTEKAKDGDKIVMEARQSNMEFTTIKVSRGVRLIIDDRTDGNIIIRTSKSLMPYVEVSVDKGVLTAKISDKVQRIDKCCTEIYIPDNRCINKIYAAGLASVVAKPTLSAAELDISATGASSVKLNATVSGKAEIECIGASNITASLTAGKCEVGVSGASKVVLSGSAREADVEVAGASSLDAEGLKCDKLDAEVVGASRLTASGRACDIEVAGASKAVVKCDGTLEAEAAGASTIIYSGNCSLVKSSNVGASTIKKQ